MKNKLFFALLIVLLYSLNGFSQQRFITIYQNGGAAIFDEYAENLKSGLNQFSYENLISGYNSNSLFVFVNDKAAQFQLDKGSSFADFILSYKGNEITLSTTSKESFSGKLTDFLYNSYFIKLRDGSTIYIPASEIVSIRFPKMNDGFNENDRVVVLAQSSKSGSGQIRIKYETAAISWEPMYSVILDENEKNASFQAIAKVAYFGTTPIESASIRFNYGNLTKKSVSRPSPKRTFSNNAKLDAEYDLDFVAETIEVSSEAIGDNYEIVLDKPIALNKNNTQFIILDDVSQIPISKKYSVKLGGYNREKFYPTVTYSMDYSKDNGFHHPTANGQVNLYIKKSNLIHSLAESRITNTALGNKLDLEIGEAFEIPISEVVTKAERITNKISTNSYKVTAVNNKNDVIKVHFERYIDRNTVITKSSLPYTSEKAGLIVFTLDLKPGELEEFTFSTKTDYK